MRQRESSSSNSGGGGGGGGGATTAVGGEAMKTAAAVNASSSSTPTKRGPKRFKLIRSLSLADFITLANGACGVCSIFFCINFLENTRFQPFLVGAFILLPLSLIFDIADGYVARARKSSSPYGKDLDSLADVVSFLVAPAVLGFTLGMRGFWDSVCLSFFVCCGIGRLARYNVTAEELSFGSGKVKYYQGFPVPTSLAIVLLLGVCYNYDLVFDNLLFGKFPCNVGDTYLGSFHPFSLIFLSFGCLMISEVKVPKP